MLTFYPCVVILTEEYSEVEDPPVTELGRGEINVFEIVLQEALKIFFYIDFSNAFILLTFSSNLHLGPVLQILCHAG